MFSASCITVSNIYQLSECGVFVLTDRITAATGKDTVLPTWQRARDTGWQEIVEVVVDKESQSNTNSITQFFPGSQPLCIFSTHDIAAHPRSSFVIEGAQRTFLIVNWLSTLVIECASPRQSKTTQDVLRQPKTAPSWPTASQGTPRVKQPWQK